MQLALADLFDITLGQFKTFFIPYSIVLCILIYYAKFNIVLLFFFLKDLISMLCLSS